MTFEDVNVIFQQLSIGQKFIIELFDPVYDFGRPIPSWELKLKIIKGKRPIYVDKYCYNPLKALIKSGILTKLEGTTNYMLTKLGEEIRKMIVPRLEESISTATKERMNFIQSEISKIKLFSSNEYAIKAWTERFILDARKFSSVIKDESEISQKKFVSALALTAWNSFYQPILINIQDFKNMLKFSDDINLSHLYMICSYFDWKFYQLGNESWFICKNIDFWKERYSDLVRFNLNQTSLKELISNSLDLENINQQTRKVLRGRDKIVEKSISDLAKEILSQKGHYWDENI